MATPASSRRPRRRWPRCLKHYGYKTAAFGKWHNTPADQTTAMGPFTVGRRATASTISTASSPAKRRSGNRASSRTRPPSNRRTTRSITSPRTWRTRASPGCNKHRAVRAGQTVLHVLGARRGARSAPRRPGVGRQVQGQVRPGLGSSASESSPARKQLGWIPADTKLTPRAANMPSWDSIPESQRAVPAPPDGNLRGLRRAHGRAGRQADRRARSSSGMRDNTIIFYIWGDNGSTAEGQNGSISELLAQNSIPNTDRAADQGARQTRRPERARRSQDRQYVPRRLGVGRQHAVPPHQARRLAFRRHAQSAGRLVAEGHQARQDAACAVPPRQRHRPDALRSRSASRRRRSSTASCRIRWMA